MDDDEDVPEAVPLPPEEPARPKVPVTIVTGFLGAGKSTLVNHILRQQHGHRIAVILNDFGDNLGIEKAMVEESSRKASADVAPADGGHEASAEAVVEEWVEVGNGCICCSVKHSFVLALEQLLERRERFDYILLETTGLANPGPVISVLWTDDELEAPLRLDSVVTVVDGRNILGQLEDGPDAQGRNLAQLQIAYADLVILNKLDLIASDPALPDRIEAHVHAINPSARILRTQRSEVAVGDILNSHLFNAKEEGALDPAVLARLSVNSAPRLDIGSVHFSVEGDVDLPKLEAWLSSLLWEPRGEEAPRERKGEKETESEGESKAEMGMGMEILRMKGAVCVPGDDALHIFQVVKELFEVSRGRTGSKSIQPTNRVLAVGYHLDGEVLRMGFEKCLAKP